MSEIPTPVLDTNEVATDQSESAFEAYSVKLAVISELVPEIETFDGLEKKARSAIIEFGLKPTLFDTPERTLVFTGMIAKYQKLEHEHEGPANRELLSDMMTVLAHDHSDFLHDKHSHDESAGFDENARRLAYDAYTDDTLTKELEEAIRSGGLFDEIKGKLGIDAENEDPFDIRVLSVAHTDIPYFGLEADRSELDTDYSMEALDEVILQRGQIAEWKDGLKKRGIDFATRLGEKELSADAWVTVIEGKTTLCMSSPFAEKIISPEITDNVDYYTEDTRARDMAVLEHEYAHTQGGANVDHEYIGANLEELRAEVFSGNKLGYNDMKSFFMDYHMFTGHDIKQEILSKPKGGANYELYASIANNVGVASMIDIIFALPAEYAESDRMSESMRNVLVSTGGYDGILGRLLERQIAFDRSGVEGRIERATEKIADIVNKPGSTLDIDLFVSIRKRQGLSIGAGIIKEYYDRQYSKAV